MFLPALIVAGILGGGLYLIRKRNLRLQGMQLPTTNAMGITMSGKPQNPPATEIPWPPEESWVPFEYNGNKYLVSPTYIAPVGIGEAVKLANDHGLVVPTPDMVDAIWKAADLKVEPHPQAHDGTLASMNSKELTDKQNAHIQSQIEGKTFSLLAGTHKDVVYVDKAFGKPVQKVGIYGWHRLNGKVIQDPMWGHALSWKDYSQGLRLIKPV